MTAYEHVVFDLDGTLIDSYEALTIALNRSGAHYLERPFTTADIRLLVGEGVERLLQKAFNIDVVPPELILRFEEEYDRVCCEESRLLEEVESTLAALQRLGIGMGVCTNKPTLFSQKIIAFLGLETFLPVVVGPDTAGARKPAAAHVLYTLEAMGGAAATSLFVGDMPIDIDAARNARLAVAAIATGSASVEELRAKEPDYLLDRLSDVVSIVAGTPVAR